MSGGGLQENPLPGPLLIMGTAPIDADGTGRWGQSHNTLVGCLRLGSDLTPGVADHTDYLTNIGPEPDTVGKPGEVQKGLKEMIWKFTQGWIWVNEKYSYIFQ